MKFNEKILELLWCWHMCEKCVKRTYVLRAGKGILLYFTVLFRETLWGARRKL